MRALRAGFVVAVLLSAALVLGQNFFGDIYQNGRRTTANLPTPSSTLIGSVIYDLDAGTVRVTQGTDWKRLANVGEVDAGSIFFMGLPSAQTVLEADPQQFFWDQTNKRLGLGTDAPTQILTIDRDAGVIFIKGFGDQRITWEQRGSVGTGSEIGFNPKFSWGSIIAGGIGTPLIRLLYSDDGDLPDGGGTPRTERAVFEVERTGTAAAIGDGNRRALYEGYIQNNDYKPVFRLSSYQDMQLELGAGGTTATAGNVTRTGGTVVTVTTNPAYAHKFSVGDHVYQSQSEADFALPSAPDYWVVHSVPAYNQFTYIQAGSNVSNASTIYYSIEPDTFHRRSDSDTLVAVVQGRHEQTIDTADGGTGGPFTGTLTYVPIALSSVLVVTQDGGVLAYDNGGGTLAGPTVSAGTINYTSGAISVTFSAAPANGTQIIATYFDDAPRHTWTPTTSKVSDYVVFGLPKWPTASLPSAASYEGYQVYDDTSNTVKFSNGSSWVSGGSGGGYDTVSLNGVALPQETTLEFSGSYWNITDSAPKTIFSINAADTSNSGLMTATAQTIGGRKQFPGEAITTDPSFTVASIDQLPSFTKNDTNTRTFYGSRIKPVFNFGGSNDNTSVTILEISSTNTATTGLDSLTLLNLANNDASLFAVSGLGEIFLSTDEGTSGQLLQSGGPLNPATWVTPNPPTATQADSTSDDSTASATDVAMAAMTFTAAKGGIHFMTFSGSIESTDGTALTEVSIYVNSVQYSNTIRQLTHAANEPIPVSLTTATNLGQGDVVEVQWNTTAGTATVHERTFSVINVP